MGIRQLILLSAFLLSDGGISMKRRGSWTIYFRNRDQALLDKFQELLIQTFGSKGFVSKRLDGTYFVRLNSNRLAHYLFKISPSYRTKACHIHPKCQHLTYKEDEIPCNVIGTHNIKGIEYPKAKIHANVFSSKKLARDFLRIYATCDGGVSAVPIKNTKGSLFVVRKVFISVKHPILSNQLTELLQWLGFSVSQYKDQIRIVNKFDIKKFKDEIGFVKGAKISGDSRYLSGLRKDFVLNKLVDNFENPSKFLDFLLKRRSLVG